MEDYRTLTAFRSDVDVSFLEYGCGYALFVLNVDDAANSNTNRRGDCRVEMRFGTALPEALQFSCTESFPRSCTWINPEASCYNEQLGTGIIVERLSDQSDVCPRVTRFDRKATANLRRSMPGSHWTVFHFPKEGAPEIFDSAGNRPPVASKVSYRTTDPSICTWQSGYNVR